MSLRTPADGSVGISSNGVRDRTTKWPLLAVRRELPSRLSLSVRSNTVLWIDRKVCMCSYSCYASSASVWRRGVVNSESLKPAKCRWTLLVVCLCHGKSLLFKRLPANAYRDKPGKTTRRKINLPMFGRSASTFKTAPQKLPHSRRPLARRNNGARACMMEQWRHYRVISGRGILPESFYLVLSVYAFDDHRLNSSKLPWSS